MTRAPSIIISKKLRQNQEIGAIEEHADALGPPDEMEQLKHLFKQEELRDDVTHSPNIRSKMKRISSSSKNLLNKKVNSLKSVHSTNAEHGDVALHEAHSDISLYKPAVSLRESAAELGSNIIKKVKRSQHKRASNDGVGMTTLLVRSMMAAPSLESIAENSDPTTPSSLKPMSRSDVGNSLTSLQSRKHYHPHHHIENKLNISVGDSIIDLKAYDGNLSSGVSMSSITDIISETSSEDDDCSELGDEVVMIDADTISM